MRIFFTQVIDVHNNLDNQLTRKDKQHPVYNLNTPTSQ
jgi:hypothetical protein